MQVRLGINPHYRILILDLICSQCSLADSLSNINVFNFNQERVKKMKRFKHLTWVIPLVVSAIWMSSQPVFAQEVLGQQVDNGVMKVTLITYPEIDQGQNGGVIISVENITSTNQVFDTSIYIPSEYLRGNMVTKVTKGDLQVNGEKQNGVSWVVTLASGEKADLTIDAPAITRPMNISDFYWIRVFAQFMKFPLKINMVDLSMVYLPLIQEASAVSAAATDISESGLFTATTNEGIDVFVEYDPVVLVGSSYAVLQVTVHNRGEPGAVFSFWFRTPAEFMSGSISWSGNGFLYPEKEDDKINEERWVIGLGKADETLRVIIPLDSASGVKYNFYNWMIDGRAAESRDLRIAAIKSRIFVAFAMK